MCKCPCRSVRARLPLSWSGTAYGWPPIQCSAEHPRMISIEFHDPVLPAFIALTQLFCLVSHQNTHPMTYRMFSIAAVPACPKPIQSKSTIFAPIYALHLYHCSIPFKAHDANPHIVDTCSSATAAGHTPKHLNKSTHSAVHILEHTVRSTDPEVHPKAIPMG